MGLRFALHGGVCELLRSCGVNPTAVFWLLKTRPDALPGRGFHFGELIEPPDLLATANTVHLNHDTYDVRDYDIDLHYSPTDLVH